MRVRIFLSAALISTVSSLGQASPLVHCKVAVKVAETSIEEKSFTFDRHQQTVISGQLEVAGVDYLIRIENEAAVALLTNRTPRSASLASDRLTREHGFGKMDIPLFLTNSLQVQVAPDSAVFRNINLWCIER